MKFALLIGIILALFGTSFCLTGTATTTRYTMADTHKTACGCTKIAGFQYTAAGSFPLFSAKKNTWCGSGCGQCFRLTAQGNSATAYTGKGGKGTIDVIVTDVCPATGNQEWCSVPKNKYGYSYHFDLNDGQGQITALKWDNPVVTFKSIPCPLSHANVWKTCECFGKNKN